MKQFTVLHLARVLLTLTIITIIVHSSLLSRVVRGQSSDCPTWTLPTNSSQCVCGKDINYIVKCNNKTKEVQVLDCYLITYDSESEESILGLSIHGCNQLKSRHHPLYSKVPSNVSELDAVVCAPLNRAGRLCGSCVKDRYPLVYSYKLDCAPCTDAENRRNWFIYILRAFLPLTFFYAFVVLFKFHALHPSVHVCILFCQLLSSPPVLRIIYEQSQLATAMGILGTIYGVWNLDFFRTIRFHSDICLKITPVQALFLDYTIAFYPLLLILVTYVLAILHSNGNRIVLLFWRPFHWALIHFRNTWDIRSSMIDVFTTFLFLSYNRIISVTFDLLIYVLPYKSDGSRTPQKFLFYDASLEYFGQEHRVYGVAAVVFYAIFVLLPLILTFLCLLTCFQKCLNLFRLNRIALHLYVDSISGYYKDGTEPGTRDCRCFAAAFLFLPTLLYLSYACTLNSYFFAVGGSVVTLFCLIFTLCQPYKEAYKQYGKVTMFFLVLMIFFHFMTLSISTAALKFYHAYRFSVYAAKIFSFLPVVYLIALTIKWLLQRTKCSVLYSKFQRTRPLANASSDSSLISAFEERRPFINYHS